LMGDDGEDRLGKTLELLDGALKKALNPHQFSKASGRTLMGQKAIPKHLLYWGS